MDLFRTERFLTQYETLIIIFNKRLVYLLHVTSNLFYDWHSLNKTITSQLLPVHCTLLIYLKYEIISRVNRRNKKFCIRSRKLTKKSAVKLIENFSSLAVVDFQQMVIKISQIERSLPVAYAWRKEGRTMFMEPFSISTWERERGSSRCFVQEEEEKKTNCNVGRKCIFLSI